MADSDAVQGWLQTLADYGGPPKPGKSVPPTTRVSAAKAGLDFVSKFLTTTGEHAQGEGLLAALNKLEETAHIVEEESSQEDTSDDEIT